MRGQAIGKNDDNTRMRMAKNLLPRPSTLPHLHGLVLDGVELLGEHEGGGVRLQEGHEAEAPGEKNK